MKIVLIFLGFVFLIFSLSCLMLVVTHYCSKPIVILKHNQTKKFKDSYYSIQYVDQKLEDWYFIMFLICLLLSRISYKLLLGSFSIPW